MSTQTRPKDQNFSPEELNALPAGEREAAQRRGKPAPRSYDDTDRNDIGNAAHFKRENGDKLRYCHAWGKWLCWGDGRWKLDDDGTVTRLAKATVAQMFQDGLDSGRPDIRAHAARSASARGLDAMVRLAQSELPVSVDDLDQNEWLLNCPNGTLDLRTGNLRDHQRHDYITKLCPTDYVSDAAAPQWERFLLDIFVDPDLVGFVQRLLGYCLTGDVSEQKLAILYGSGANGKSTLLNAFMNVVGPDFSMQCMPDFLMQRRGESHPTEKASLHGKRFVSCVETEAGRKLAESTVKMLTGGEKIMARRMREDFWEFSPTHKLVLCTNHKPVVSGTDHGIWRRLLLVPFTQRFEGSQIDKQLPEKLKAEAEGILAWLVRGCLDWQQNGLNPPSVVTDATDAYRSQEDVLGRFVDECCDPTPNQSVRFSVLYGRLTEWCSDTGDELPSKKKVGIWLAEQGYAKFLSNGTCWRGLVLKD